MSSQFEYTIKASTTPTAVADPCLGGVAVGASPVGIKWPPRDHLQHAAHMAVHTPIQVPRTSIESSQPYGASPHIGFHVPASESPSSCRKTPLAGDKGQPQKTSPSPDCAKRSTAGGERADEQLAVPAASNANHDNRTRDIKLDEGYTECHTSAIHEDAWPSSADNAQEKVSSSLETTTATASSPSHHLLMQRQTYTSLPLVSPNSSQLSSSQPVSSSSMPQSKRISSSNGDKKTNSAVHTERGEERMHTILDHAIEDATSTDNTLDPNEASKLLLNFSQNILATDVSQANSNTNSSGSDASVHTNEDPASNGPASVSEVVESLAADRAMDDHSGSNSTNQATSNGQQQKRTYFRAPGLEAPRDAVNRAADSNVSVCPICGFSCPSKFHYNSHMNTHSAHTCSMCNYTSRTEGRLRKHMKDSHTREQKIAAGIDITDSPPSNNTHRSSAGGAVASFTNSNDSTLVSNGDGNGISTTMASIVDIVNRAAAAASSTSGSVNSTGTASSTEALLRMVDNFKSGNSLYGNSNAGDRGASLDTSSTLPSALDHIRALTERTSSLMPNQQLPSTLSGILGIADEGNDSMQMPENTEDLVMNGSGDSINLFPGLTTTTNNGAVNNSEQPQQPARRSGRPKTYKCKQCAHLSKSKEEQWAHVKTHIPLEKQLTCKLCGFVTEYKHHLEYHIRNHNGSKPFRCQICGYACVNKSMLNSHMKSHTPVYQFRCQDCTYQTKYCHSLKMHLRKYNHRRAPGTVTLDSDSHDEDKPESDDSAAHSLQQQFSDQFGSIVNAVSAGDNPNGIKQDDHHQVHHHHHPALNSLLLQHQQQQAPQPIVSNTAASIQYASQLLLRQQQLEQMNELMRMANVFNCSHCEFSTPSNEEMARHNMAHILAANQQQHQHTANVASQPPSFANLYHLAEVQHQQQQQQRVDLLNNGGNNQQQQPMDFTAQIQHEIAMRIQQQQQHEESSRRQAMAAALAAAAAATTNNPLKDPRSLLLHNAAQQTQTAQHEQQPQQIQEQVVRKGISNDCTEEEHNMSPAASDHHDSAAESSASPSLSKTSADGGTSSGSPSSGGATPGGSRKRKQSKTIKVDQISVHLQGKTSPTSSEEAKRSREYTEFNGTPTRLEASGFHTIVTPLPHPIVPTSATSPDPRGEGEANGGAGGRNFSVLLAHLNNIQNQQRQQSMPYTCQHCMMAFQDRAMYQIHLGYHGYETPFRCNRCGHLSNSPLEFNLHLYQAKHD